MDLICRDLELTDLQCSLLLRLALGIFWSLLGLPTAPLADRYNMVGSPASRRSVRDDIHWPYHCGAKKRRDSCRRDPMDVMPRIELPRPLDAYFAFAELPANRQGRRFTITFPYFEGERLDRLQWWWQVSTAQERVGGEAGLEQLRREATDRFRQHIERWLAASRKRLFDGNPFPRLEPVPDALPVAAEAAPEAVAAWPIGRVSNG